MSDNQQTAKATISAINEVLNRMVGKEAKARVFISDAPGTGLMVHSDSLEEILGPLYAQVCARFMNELKQLLFMEMCKAVAVMRDKPANQFIYCCGEDKPMMGSIVVCRKCGVPYMFMEDMSMDKVGDTVMNEIKLKQPVMYTQIMMTVAAVRYKIVYN